MVDLEIALNFDPGCAGAVNGPEEALKGLLDLIGQVKPDRVTFWHRLADERTHVDFRLGFKEEAASKIALIKAAIIRAEGEAGFTSAFDFNFALPHNGWQVARLACNDPKISGKPVALPLPIAQSSPKFFRSFRLTDAAFGYVLDCRRVSPDRTAAVALAAPIALAELGGSNAVALASSLRYGMKLAAEEGWLAAEGVCLRDDADDAMAVAVEAILANHLAEIYPALPPEFAYVAWENLDAFEQPVAPGSPLNAIEARRRSDYPFLAAETAISGFTQELWPSRPAPLSPAVPRSVSPAPFFDTSFAFLSYAHKDADWAVPLAESLERHGTRVWFDRGIEAGAAWDEYLERCIRNSALLIACLSPNYEASRYCRREIKFADLLAKPILPVAQQPYCWGEGLQFMFQELQIFVDANPADPEPLATRISRMAPACCPGSLN